jgi:hypothetical protein
MNDGCGIVRMSFDDFLLRPLPGSGMGSGAGAGTFRRRGGLTRGGGTAAGNKQQGDGSRTGREKLPRLTPAGNHEQFSSVTPRTNSPPIKIVKGTTHGRETAVSEARCRLRRGMIKVPATRAQVAAGQRVDII